MSGAHDVALCYSDRELLRLLTPRRDTNVEIASKEGKLKFLYAAATVFAEKVNQSSPGHHIQGPKAIYVVESDNVVAAYLGVSGNLVFSSGALKLWNEEELKGVMAHEMSHKAFDEKYGDLLSPLKALTTAVSSLGVAAALIEFATHPTTEIFSTLCHVAVASSLLYSAYNCASRAIEYKMDKDGADVFGTEGIISAVSKLATAHVSHPVLANLLNPHPSIEDRISRLKGQSPQRTL